MEKHGGVGIGNDVPHVGVHVSVPAASVGGAKKIGPQARVR